MLLVLLEIDETSGHEPTGRDDVQKWMELNLSALANFTGVQGQIIEIREIDSGGITAADSPADSGNSGQSGD